MSKNQNPNYYNLEERTFNFAKRNRLLIKQVPKTVGGIEDSKQLIRSSGSVHSNYIEANEALSKKDYYYRVRVCRKETKESRSWLRLIDVGNSTTLEEERASLIQEANELMKIFGSIIEKEKNSHI